MVSFFCLKNIWITLDVRFSVFVGSFDLQLENRRRFQIRSSYIQLVYRLAVKSKIGVIFCFFSSTETQT